MNDPNDYADPRDIDWFGDGEPVSATLSRSTGSCDADTPADDPSHPRTGHARELDDIDSLAELRRAGLEPAAAAGGGIVIQGPWGRRVFEHRDRGSMTPRGPATVLPFTRRGA